MVSLSGIILMGGRASDGVNGRFSAMDKLSRGWGSVPWSGGQPEGRRRGDRGSFRSQEIFLKPAPIRKPDVIRRGGQVQNGQGLACPCSRLAGSALDYWRLDRRRIQGTPAALQRLIGHHCGKAPQRSDSSTGSWSSQTARTVWNRFGFRHVPAGCEAPGEC